MKRLDDLVEAGRSGLVTLWGRRRIGKTRLLIEWSKKHDGLYTVADLSAEAVQRRYVADSLGERFDGFGDVEYPTWRALLQSAARVSRIANWHGPLILDEFPYLVESSPSLPSVVQAWVDNEAREAGLLVAISGSVQHMMQGLTMDADAPLYGRALEAMALPPMTVSALKEALSLRDPADCIRAYAAWGGVARYWELAEPFGDRLDDAVDQLVMSPLGPLHQEPDRLLLEERPPAQSLRPLLDVIGAGAHRVSEIAGRLGIAATSLSRPIARLVALGLVRRELPFGDPTRGGKRALYRIADPFFRLWFRVVAPHRGFLAAADRRGRLALWRKFSRGLTASTWEELCRAAVPALTRQKMPLEEIDGLTPAGRFWRGSGPEWDVVSRSFDGRGLILGEVKWSEKPVEEADLQSIYKILKARGIPPVGHDAIERVVYAIFVPRCAPRVKAKRLPFKVIDANDVIRAFDP